MQRIMPYVAQAIQMKQSLEMQIGGYTVLTVLASNGTLTDTVIDAAMEAVVVGWTEESRRYGLLCLVTLAQSRDSVTLTESVVESLLSLQYVVFSLGSLLTSGTWYHKLKDCLRRRSAFFLFPLLNESFLPRNLESMKHF